LFASQEILNDMKVQNCTIDDIKPSTHLLGKSKACLSCSKLWSTLSSKILPRIYLSYGFMFFHAKMEIDNPQKKKEIAEKIDKLLEEINKDERFDETPSFTPKSSIDYACAGGSILNDEWLPCTEKLPKFPLLIVETIGLYECHMFHNGICCINFISKHFVGKTKAKKKTLKIYQHWIGT